MDGYTDIYTHLYILKMLIVQVIDNQGVLPCRNKWNGIVGCVEFYLAMKSNKQDVHKINRFSKIVLIKNV